jgi:uncharacterized membrane protein YphA (DoxX/SURF4 family)
MTRPGTTSISRQLAISTWPLRLAIAAVWIYHGLWNKLLSPGGRHSQIIDSIPTLAGVAPDQLRIAIGLAEVATGVWVLSGLAPRAAAAAQSMLLVTMNVGGLLWAPEQIADPGAMVVQNVAFLALIWVAATREGRARER